MILGRNLSAVSSFLLLLMFSTVFMFTLPSVAHAQGSCLSLPFSGSISSAGNAFAVTNTGTGAAIYAEGDGTGSNGIVAVSAASGGSAVYAVNSSSGVGLYGITTSGSEGILGTGPHVGVYGVTSSTTDAGVLGANSSTGMGVEGTASGSGSWGVYGSADIGVRGDGNFGVYGSGTTAGVKGSVSATGGKAIQGQASCSTCNYAGYFNGNVYITGSMTASSKSFLADHPLDPANKYLRHASIESNELKNLYDGIVTTDDKGNATVSLPDWFQALNGDYRYQLAVVGGFADVTISKEVSNNSFGIRTSKPNTRVSWQVTGVRHDAWAKAHPLEVESNKSPAERGKYLDPVAFGKPESDSVAQVSYAQSIR